MILVGSGRLRAPSRCSGLDISADFGDGVPFTGDGRRSVTSNGFGVVLPLLTKNSVDGCTVFELLTFASRGFGMGELLVSGTFTTEVPSVEPEAAVARCGEGSMFASEFQKILAEAFALIASALV